MLSIISWRLAFLKCGSTKIEWKPGKNVTVELKQVKQRRRGGRGGGAIRTITKEMPCDSFFRFFSPPQIPEGGADEQDVRS